MEHIKGIEIVRELHKLMYLLGKSLDKKLEEKECLSLSQFLIIAGITSCPLISQSGLALYLGVTEAAISRQIELLRKQKLLVKNTSSKRIGKNKLVLTEEGEKEWKKAKRVMDGVGENIFTTFDGEERRLFVSLCTKVRTTLEKN